MKKILLLLLAILLPVFCSPMRRNLTPKKRPHQLDNPKLYRKAIKKAALRHAPGLAEEEAYNQQYASSPAPKGPATIQGWKTENIKHGMRREHIKIITLKIARALMQEFASHFNGLLNKSDRTMLLRCLKKSAKELIIYGVSEAMTMDRFTKFVDRTNREIS